MSSWRARIGKVSLSRGDTYIYEFYQIAPKNILLTVIATTVKKLEPGNFSRAFKACEEAALTVVKEGAQTIIFGGDPVFVSQAPGNEEALCSKLEKGLTFSLTA